MFKRPLDPFDKFFNATGQMMQLAIHLKNPSHVEPILEKVQKMFASTQTRVEGEFLVRDTSMDVPIVRLPENFRSMREACNYMFHRHSPKIDQCMGIIGANSDTIVINSHHTCTDGGFFLQAFNAIRDGIEIEPPSIPRGTYERFPHEIENARASPPQSAVNPRLTRFTAKDKKMTIDYPFVLTVDKTVQTKTLKCFDQKLQRPTGLTDALYTNVILSGLAYENRSTIGEDTGITTVMNMRPYLKNGPTFEDGCILTLVPVCGRGTNDTTIAEFMKTTRKDFEERIQRGEHFGLIKDFTKPVDMTKVINGITMTVTNIGQFRLGGPIDDVAVSATITGSPKGLPFYTFLHYAIIGENRNDAVSELLYGPTATSQREMQMLLDSTIYGLQNIGLNESMGAALEKMKDFQHNFIKNEYPKYLVK